MSGQHHFELESPQQNTAPRYWLTPPTLYAKLDLEYGFDFDPCPCPLPTGYNGLAVPWGKMNYVNPPFNRKDAPHGGPASFARKAIEEQKKGNSSVFILPVPWSIGLLLAAGAKVRPAGMVGWLDVDTGRACKRSAYQALIELRP